LTLTWLTIAARTIGVNAGGSGGRWRCKALVAVGGGRATRAIRRKSNQLHRLSVLRRQRPTGIVVVLVGDGRQTLVE